MDRTNEDVVREYAAAAAANDLATLTRLRHPEWMTMWPQSGERVVGSDAFAAVVDGYPGGKPTTVVDRVVGAEDRWVVTARQHRRPRLRQRRPLVGRPGS